MIDFELIRGKIQRHRLSSIVHNCLEALNEVQRNDRKGVPIWNLLSLIKWSYLHTSDSALRKPLQSHDFHQLLTLINEFEVKYNRLVFKDAVSVRQSMRIIAYQQFAYQDPFKTIILGRQMQLYLSQPDISLMFEQKTGISIKNFLEFCYFTFFFFHFDELGNYDFRYEGDLFGSYFELFRSKWGNKSLHDFLNLLTIRDKDDFSGLQKMNDERLQLYETNFFILKPFIFFKGQYRLPHKAIFTQTIKHFIYNYLKTNAPGFPELFGKRLERYIELGLTENHLEWENENKLKRNYKLTKTADFKLADNILMEVKAIELNPRVGVMRTKDLMVSDLDSTIIKAYIQLISTAHVIAPDSEWYGIIITYKEMYLGFGSDAWDEFMAGPVQQYCIDNQLDISSLPPSNLFFISIDDWDHMMQAVKNQNVSLRQILDQAKSRNMSTDHAEKVMLMEQVLNKDYHVPAYTLSYLADKHNELDFIPDR